MVSLLVLALMGPVFAEMVDYEPTGINGITLSNSVGQTTIYEPVDTETEFFHRTNVQKDVCTIIEQKCGSIGSSSNTEITDLGNEIAELEFRINELEANQETIFDVLENIWEEIGDIWFKLASGGK